MPKLDAFKSWLRVSWHTPPSYKRLFVFTLINLAETLLLYYWLGQDLQRLIEAFDWLWNHIAPIQPGLLS